MDDQSSSRDVGQGSQWLSFWQLTETEVHVVLLAIDTQEVIKGLTI